MLVTSILVISDAKKNIKLTLWNIYRDLHEIYLDPQWYLGFSGI